ncbi:hypothetical protein GCK72_002815 [Caenorhabditis remanei]|uniref:Uncharacterized protein n=1 Tax=Caenorhabditis remanei TaxID=31234 RepID=A0A6A5HUZ9_CAERE|nr:hypothetical protein GCK72_002815 [Caenorhabditis remanei]KAF1770991.1 hypothetical protein GCK72_002815 [Caenorhabditis remanei]
MPVTDPVLTPTQVGPAADPALLANDTTAMTPTQEGPAADPALLANAGCTADASEAGINMAVNAMQKFGRELEQFPAEGRKLVEKAMSSISTTNHRSTRSGTSSQRSSRSGRGAEQDSFVRIVNTLVDMTPASTPSKPIIETFVLSSVILTVFSLSSLLGGYLLAPFVTLIIPPVGAAIVSALVAPAAIYYQLSKGYGALDGFRLLVTAAAAQGVLTGAALAHFTITSEPFIALSTIASSFVIAMLNPTTRSSSLSTTVATSILIHSSLGALEGALTPIYFALTGMYTLAALVPVQLATRDQQRANVNLYSAVLVGVTIASKCLAYGILGASDAPITMEQTLTLEGEGMAEQQINA